LYLSRKHLTVAASFCETPHGAVNRCLTRASLLYLCASHLCAPRGMRYQEDQASRAAMAAGISVFNIIDRALC